MRSKGAPMNPPALCASCSTVMKGFERKRRWEAAWSVCLETRVPNHLTVLRNLRLDVFAVRAGRRRGEGEDTECSEALLYVRQRGDAVDLAVHFHDDRLRRPARRL